MNDGQDIGQDRTQDPDRTAAEGVLPPPEPLLTIAHAARRLGVDPKQVRRYADKLTGQDRTPIGQSPVRVRLSAVQALRDGVKSEAESRKDSEQDIGQDTAGQRQDSPAESVLPEHSHGSLPALVYQQRVADLETMNSELKADKERLYGLLETAQANLAREQALRSLPAPQAAEMEVRTTTSAAGLESFWVRLIHLFIHGKHEK